MSQYLGAKEQEKANASAGQLILLSAILAYVVAALCILFARPMISACYGSNRRGSFWTPAYLYLKIIRPELPLPRAVQRGRASSAAWANSKISMQISVLMNIINNIVGNADLAIYRPEMGV